MLPSTSFIWVTCYLWPSPQGCTIPSCFCRRSQHSLLCLVIRWYHFQWLSHINHIRGTITYTRGTMPHVGPHTPTHHHRGARRNHHTTSTGGRGRGGCNAVPCILCSRVPCRHPPPPWYGPGGGLEASRWWAVYITQSIAYRVA